MDNAALIEHPCERCGMNHGKYAYVFDAAGPFQHICRPFGKDYWWRSVGLCQDCLEATRASKEPEAWEIPFMLAAAAFHCLGININRSHARREAGYLEQIMCEGERL